MTTVTYNLVGLLTHFTGDASWAEVDGPASRCGLDYYYRARDGAVAYINIDQSHMTVQIGDEIIYDGDIEDDADLAAYVSRE